MKIRDILNEQPAVPAVPAGATNVAQALATSPSAVGVQSVLGFKEVTRPQQFMSGAIKANSGLKTTLTAEENRQLAYAFISLMKMDPDGSARSMQNMRNVLKQQATTTKAATLRTS